MAAACTGLPWLQALWGNVGGPLALTVEEQEDRSEEEAQVTGWVLGGVCEASELLKDCC